jgi:hypothetical protein
MSYPLVIRLMLAMALMPEASYCESLARLAGLLADIPFALAWHVPTGKVVTDWRVLVPADLMESLFWRAAGPLITDDEPSAVLLAGMMVCAADGMLVNLADTPEIRAMFGCTGTAAQEGEGAAPFPQLRIVTLTARAGRAVLGGHPGTGAGRGADPARPPGPPPPGPGRRPRDLLRSQLPRPRADLRDPGRGRARRGPGKGRDQPAAGPRRRLAARRIPPDLAERPVREE